MSSIPSPDAKAVVRALEALTTQARRIADALTTPVVTYEDGADDAPPTAVAEDRQPAYAAVYAYIRQLGDVMPTSRIDRNAIIWHAVNAALDARPVAVGIDPSGSDGVVTAPVRKIAHPVPAEAYATWTEQQPAAPCAQHPHAPTFNGLCGGCIQYPADMRPAAAADEEQTLRLLRRESLLVLLTRLQRGRALTEAEVGTLRQHVETEMREAETARSVAAGNKRHVQILVPELEQAQAAIERVRAIGEDPLNGHAPQSRDQEAYVRGWSFAIYDVRRALDGTEQPTTTEEN